MPQEISQSSFDYLYSEMIHQVVRLLANSLLTAHMILHLTWSIFTSDIDEKHRWFGTIDKIRLLQNGRAGI